MTLAPCPFCGTTPVMLARGSNTHAQIACVEPDCTLEVMTFTGPTEDVTRAWNTRAAPKAKP